MGEIIDFIAYKNKRKEVYDKKLDSLGEVIDLNLVKKQNIKKDLINNILEPIGFMWSGLEDLYEAVKLSIDEDMVNFIHFSIVNIEELYNMFKKPMDMDIDKLIFKLKIILEESDYFTSVFSHLFDNQTIEYYQLKFFVQLVNLYIGYVRLVLSNDRYDYNDLSNTLSEEEYLVTETINNLGNNIQKERYTDMLSQLVRDKLSDRFSDIQWYAIKKGIDTVLDDFLGEDALTVTKCFSKILGVYIKKGILNEETKEGIDMKFNESSNDFKMCKNYQKAENTVYEMIGFVDTYVLDNKKSKKITDKLDGILIEMDNIYDKKSNKAIFKHIEDVMKHMSEKILSLIKIEDVNDNIGYDKRMQENLKKVMNDEIVVNNMTLICTDLLDYMNDNNEQSYIESKNFDYIWAMVNSYSIRKILNDIVRKDILLGENNDIYEDSKYRKILTDIIVQSSYDDYCDMETDIIKNDFREIIDVLKKSLLLEKTINLYGISEIADDFNKLDYRNVSSSKKYLDMVDNIFSKLRYNFNLREFLNNANYNPRRIKLEDEMISLYSDKDYSLVMDNNSYYVIENNKVIEDLGKTIIDYNYTNKDITYSMVLENIISKYHLDKDRINVRKKIK